MNSLGFEKLMTALLSLVLPVVVSCGAKQESDSDAAAAKAADSVVIELAGRDTVCILDLLRETHDVDYSSSATGAFINGIDGVENGGGYFWIYTVNGQPGMVACDKYFTFNGQAVQWHFRNTVR